MDVDIANKYIKNLEELGVNKDCPRCGHNKFTIADGYFNHPIQKDFKDILIGGGLTMPTIITICEKCGFISQHALGIVSPLIKKEKN